MDDLAYSLAGGHLFIHWLSETIPNVLFVQFVAGDDVLIIHWSSLGCAQLYAQHKLVVFA